MTTSTVLLLDVMDTIVHDPFWDLPDFFGVPFPEIWKDKHPTAWVDFELDRIDSETFLASFYADGRDYDRDGLLALFRDGFRWIDGMKELLTDLRAAGVEMHALSNYPRWYEMIEERLGLSEFLEWSFVSCLTGVRKPDPRAFSGAAATLGRPPSQCLFVDDRGSNCKGAVSVGMAAWRFDGADGLRQALVVRGLLPG